eukprot:XP_025006216.1 interleukin-12 subunit beta-like isoform X1 [Gallus gallus]
MEQVWVQAGDLPDTQHGRKIVLQPAGQRMHPGRAVWDGLGKGTQPSPTDPNPLSPALSGEKGRNASCQADSYRGSFRCSWIGSHSTVFRARLTHSDGSVGDWVPAARHGRRFSANFTDPSFCPFAEELRPLQLHFEGISYTSFYNFSIYFFVRDIGELSPQTSPGWGRGPGSPSGPQPHAEPRCALLPAVRPDPPQELTAHLREGQLHLAWAPPASWPLPKSYFALLYWLQYELPNGTQVDTFVEGTEKMSLQERVRRVRISCQDPYTYTNTSWSPWSRWREVDTARPRRG